jgi:hypothetical protein
MNDQVIHVLTDPDRAAEPLAGGEVHGPAAGVAPGQEERGTPTPDGGTDGSPVATSRHAEAGRKGARRVHQLIERGRLYEQEHGLKRGRQRLRQLIEEGKLYEREHGLGAAGTRRGRLARMGSEQVLRTFLQSLLRMVRPAYRQRLAGLLSALEGEGE